MCDPKVGLYTGRYVYIGLATNAVNIWFLHTHIVEIKYIMYYVIANNAEI